MDLSSISDLDPNESGEWPFVIKIIVIILLCVAIWGAGYYFIIGDKKMALAAADQKEETLKKEFEYKQAKAINLNAYQVQMEEMKVTFSSMLEQLPKKNEVADLLVSISSAGLVNGLTFNLFKPGGERKVDFYAELPIEMSVTGTYHQFGAFVSAVAALPRIVTMHNLTLTPNGGKEGSENRMTMKITAKTYRYFDDEAE